MCMDKKVAKKKKPKKVEQETLMNGMHVTILKDYVVNSTEKELNKLQKQIDKLKLSISKHDDELQPKKDQLKKLEEEFDEIEQIKNLSSSVVV